MKKLSEDLSPEEKAKKFIKGGRKFRRHDMMSKDTSVNMLSIKMGRYRDELSGFIKEHDVFSETLDELLQTVESILNLPTIIVELNEMAKSDKEACPHCEKEFKQLSRHKCKLRQAALDVGAEED